MGEAINLLRTVCLTGYIASLFLVIWRQKHDGDWQYPAFWSLVFLVNVLGIEP